MHTHVRASTAYHVTPLLAPITQYRAVTPIAASARYRHFGVRFRDSEGYEPLPIVGGSSLVGEGGMAEGVDMQINRLANRRRLLQMTGVPSPVPAGGTDRDRP